MSATCLLETSPRGFPVDSQALGDCKALPTGHRKESGILDGHQVHLTAQCVNVKIISYGPKMVFWCNNSIYLVSLYDIYIYIIYLFFPSAQLYIYIYIQKITFWFSVVVLCSPNLQLHNVGAGGVCFANGKKVPAKGRVSWHPCHVICYEMWYEMWYES